MRKLVVWSLVLLGSGLLLLICCVIVGLWRYIDTGANPLREIRYATIGESVEVNEHTEPQQGVYQQLMVDSIDHGKQYMPPAKRDRGDPFKDFSRLPTTYYHPAGPVGLVLQGSNWFRGPTNTFHADARFPASLVANGTATALGSPWTQIASALSEPPIGVIMMNNGTPAGYARPYQTIDFYERDPAIVRLSIVKEPDLPKFTYIADAQKRGAVVRVFEGNERKAFKEKAPQQFYRYLIVDTAHGHPGLVSKELLTQEALHGYFAALVEDGIVAIHTSNRNFTLPPVVAATANSAGLAHLDAHDTIQAPGPRFRYTTEWVLLARKAEYLATVVAAHAALPPAGQAAGVGGAFNLHPIPIQAGLVWKDGASNSLALGRR
jgi:hypothetical protein